jgi:SAM-dependent methyltransferase
MNALRCTTCSKTYPIREGIPDFILEELSQSADPELRRMRIIDRMAGIYETKLWYPLVLNVYGGIQSPSLRKLIEIVTSRIRPVQGRVLDVACGPGTYGRRIASASREVFGIDVSPGMLRQGAAYLKKEGLSHVHFARARVEGLPFKNEFFEAAICAGSLHLFTDTVFALREIARVMKPGGILTVFTFGTGRRGILKYPRMRERGKAYGLHVFELTEVGEYLAAAGFQDFDPTLRGSILTFGARKKPA